MYDTNSIMDYVAKFFDFRELCAGFCGRLYISDCLYCCRKVFFLKSC